MEDDDFRDWDEDFDFGLDSRLKSIMQSTDDCLKSTKEDFELLIF